MYPIVSNVELKSITTCKCSGIYRYFFTIRKSNLGCRIDIVFCLFTVYKNIVFCYPVFCDCIGIIGLIQLCGIKQFCIAVDCVCKFLLRCSKIFFQRCNLSILSLNLGIQVIYLLYQICVIRICLIFILL